MKRLFLLIVFVASFLCQISAQSKVYEIKSPDKKICFSLTVSSMNSLMYKVSVNGKDVIDWSAKGYTYDPQYNCQVVDILDAPKVYKSKDVWNPVWGKRSLVKDVFNLWSVNIPTASIGFMGLDVRVYNDGVAFRMSALENNLYEYTDFCFSGDYTAWYYNGERHNIGPEKLSDANGERLPLITIVTFAEWNWRRLF